MSKPMAAIPLGILYIRPLDFPNMAIGYANVQLSHLHSFIMPPADPVALAFYLPQTLPSQVAFPMKMLQCN